MAQNFNPNPQGNVNANYWNVSGACLVNTTADGIRIRKTTTGAGDAALDDQGMAPGGFRYGLGSIQIRRNSSSSVMPQGIRFMVYTDSGWSSVDTDLGSGVFPVGQFVALPVIRNSGLSKAGGGFQIRFFGGGIYDITMRNAFVCKQTEWASEGYVGATIDSNDASFTATVPTNSLTGTFQHDDPDEFVDQIKWEWGHGGLVDGPQVAFYQRNKTHTFPTAGTYPVKLTGTNFAGQSVTVTKNVQVPSGTYDANFVHSASYLNLDVDASSSVGAVINAYSWNWGDSTTSTGKFATHRYTNPGVYNVALTISNSLGQTNTETKQITITAPPSAALYFTDDKDLLSVKFFPSVITSGTIYEWTFGDGQTSTARYPTNVYATPGDYTVTLKINGTTTATRTITVTSRYTPISQFGDALRLEVQQKPGEDVIWNRTPNPNGEQGAFGWSTPVSGSLIDSSNTATGTYDHGQAGWKLWYRSSGSGAQTFYSAPVSVAAGKYVAAALSVPYTEGYHRLTVEALDAAGAILGSSGTTGYLQVGSNQRTAPYLLPASTKSARLKVQFTSDAGSGVPVLNKHLLFNRVMLATAATSSALTSLVYTESVEWEDILGPTHEIEIDREPMDVSTLQATILDASLDPAVSSTIRPGAKVRLRVATEDDQGNEVYESIYSGTISDADVAYERDQLKYVESLYPELTNWVLNPSFEGTSNLTAMQYGGTVARSTAWSASGTYSLQYTSTATTGAHNVILAWGPQVDPRDRVSLTVTIKATVAARISLKLYSLTTGTGYFGEQFFDFTAGQVRTIELKDVLVPNAHVAGDSLLPYITFFNAGTSTDFSSTGVVASIDKACCYNSGQRALGFDNVLYFDGGTDGAAWVGAANNSNSTYRPDGTYFDPQPGDPKKVRITLNAVDNLTALSNVIESRGVAAISELPMLLEGTAVPYRVNGSAGQVPAASVVAVNDNASLLDQIAVTRDTNSGYAHMDRNGVLVVNDPANVPTAVMGVLDDKAYSDVDATFSTKELINSVLVRWLRFEPSTGETREVEYGPFENTDSIAEWGLAREEFTFQGAVENPTAIAARANSILAANSTPGRRVNSLTVPIRNAEDLIRGKAMLDIMDLVAIKHEQTDTDQLARVTKINHRITPKRWTMSVGFNSEGSVARPIAVPSPVVFSDVAGLAAELPGSINLNNYAAPGQFAQTQNSEAASGLNYPVPQAGLLEVAANSDRSMVWQRYTVYGGGTYSGQTWSRTRYNGTWTAWSVVGGATVSPHGSRRRVGTQTAANNTAVIIDLNGATALDGITWDATNLQYVIQRAGLYSLAGAITYRVASGAVARYEAYVMVNGTTVAGALLPWPAGTTGYAGCPVATIRRLAVGDTVQLGTKQTSGASQLIHDSPWTYLDLAWIAP